MKIKTIKKEIMNQHFSIFIIEIGGSDLSQKMRNRSYRATLMKQENGYKIDLSVSRTEKEKKSEFINGEHDQDRFNQNEKKLLKIQQELELHKEQIKEEIVKKYRLQLLFI